MAKTPSKIQQGSCIGTLYIAGGNRPTVHNGKFKCAFYKGIGWVKYTYEANAYDSTKGYLPDKICVIHYSKNQNGNLVSECRIFNNIVEIAKTPMKFKNKCPGNYTKVITPGTCIGFKNTISSGGFKVNNGKFLYAVNNNNQVVCQLDNGPQSNIQYIVYEHFVTKTAPGGNVRLDPKHHRRYGIVSVRKTTLQCQEGKKCTC